MKAFLDTTVLMAAFIDHHPEYVASRALLERLDKRTGATSTHCLAELYANLSGGPSAYRVRPAEAVFYLSHLQKHLKLITLTEREVIDAIEGAAGLAITGGGIYDALIGRAGLKSNAQYIYTYNKKHFTRLGDAIAKRVRAPG